MPQQVSNVTYIYVVTGIEGNSNKVYVGKTKNTSRERDHKNKYGNGIEFAFIDYVESLERKYWQPLETYWIEQFNAWGFNVVNVKKKGGSGVEYHTEDTKQKIRAKNLVSSRRGIDHHNFGKPNPALSRLNKLKVGRNHPMYGKINLGASKSSSARVGSNNPNYSKVWITDGIVSKMINQDSEVPSGFHLGRTYIRK